MSGADRPSVQPAVRHVLLDADGVLQHVPTDWRARLEAFFGDDAEAVLAEAWELERPCLRGDGDFLALLADLMRRHGDPVSAERLHAAVWTSIEQLPASLDLVRRLRDAGYGVHLGTNQERHRGTHMRAELGYDELFDVCVYSWEIGVAKPDPAYFERAVAMIGSTPGEVLFVDDRADNVEAARSVGLVGVHWVHRDGLDVLERALADAGVVPATR